MSPASLLNENLAHKIVQALMKDGAISPENYGTVTARVLQITDEVRATGLDFGGAAGLTGADALTIVAGAADDKGSYQNHPHLVPAFQRGMHAVQDAIRNKLVGGRCTFAQAYEVARDTLDSLRPTEYGVEAEAVHEGAKNVFLLLGLASRYGFTDNRVLEAYQRGTDVRNPPVSFGEPTVSEERGEQLIADLEEGIASPAAEYLHSRILAGDKKAALKALAQERMTGQDAEDLYAYCRHKWLGKRLTLVEIPREQAEEVIRKNLPSEEVFDGFGPEYLVRRGESVVTGYAMEQRGRLWLSIARDRIEVKDVSQLWMVVELPTSNSHKAVI